MRSSSYSHSSRSFSAMSRSSSTCFDRTAHVAIEAVPHHGAQVAPLGVRDDEDLLAGVLQVEERERRLVVENDEPLRLAADLLFELPFHVRRVEARPDRPERLVVTDPG